MTVRWARSVGDRPAQRVRCCLTRPEPRAIASPGFEPLRFADATVVHESRDAGLTRPHEVVASHCPTPSIAGPAGRRNVQRDTIAGGEIDRMFRVDDDEAIGDQLHDASALEHMRCKNSASCDRLIAGGLRVRAMQSLILDVYARSNFSWCIMGSLLTITLRPRTSSSSCR